MPNVKVRPIIVFDYPEIHQSESLKLADKWQDDYASGNRNDLQYYWHARRAFLSSYQFSEENKCNKKLKGSLKELNEAAMRIFSDIRQEVSKRRLGIRVFKVKFVGPSSAAVMSVGCLMPWLNKRELIDI